MKLFLISDTHFGVRNCSPEWLQIQMESIDWFTKEIKKKSSSGDRIIHLGDVYDSRQSLHMRALNAVPKRFKTLSSILPIDIILGNHDCHDKSTNDINSVDPTLGLLDNISIMTEPEVREIGGRKIGFMPWRYGEESERPKEEKKAMDILADKGAEILFCHTDMKGASFNPWQKIEHGCSQAEFSKFKIVFSGHIHHRQTVGNVIFVGPPYSMTRSDVENSKGYWIIDLDDLKYEFVENPICPKFIKVNIENIVNLKLEDIRTMFHNNYVDILINFHESPDFPFQELARLLDGSARGIYPIGDRKKQEKTEAHDIQITETTMDVLELGTSYIEAMSYDEKIKERLKKSITELYNRAISQKA